ncbi:hypothetical protein BDZ89DRAFT_1144583 [Hymenopellis radicata]|nr:hypothetical protein BDZ89DRAFT_1144583 [Hymenopellis radicata]
MPTSSSPQTIWIELSSDEEESTPQSIISSSAATARTPSQEASASHRSRAVPPGTPHHSHVGDPVDSLADSLATSLSLAPTSQNALYSVRAGATSILTGHWYEAGSQQHENAQVQCLSPKRRQPRRKDPVYVVFRGSHPGVYADFQDVQGTVDGQSGVLWASYLTLALAASAYQYGRRQPGLVYSTQSPPPTRTFKRVCLEDPKLALYPGDTPLSQGAHRTSWHVVYCGIQPGVYRTYIEAAIQYIGVPGALYETYATYGQARDEYMCACSDKRIVRVDVV